jgi:murein DD-endopeptidase MepM/ murein hydrolase activator NlpD
LAVGLIVLGVVIAKTQESLPSQSEDNLSLTNASDGLAAAQGISTTGGKRVQQFLPLPSPNPAEPPLVDKRVDEQAVSDPTVGLDATVVRVGDSLARLFQRQALPYEDLLALLELGDAVQPLKTLHPGDELYFQKNASGGLRGLIHPLGHSQFLMVSAGDQGFAVETLAQPLEVRSSYAQGEIRHSLFVAAQEAGVSENTIMEMANLFGWDIDFALDVRAGDRFSIVSESQFRDGEKVGEGPILAAEFINQGKRYRAVRYTTPDGRTDYFSPEGRTLRKAFLRAPVEFARISSRFNPGRYHPVLHRVRAHKGVDYAAPTGTPVRSTGDGKVIFRGSKGGYGNAVIIQHGNRYTTLFAHLSRFARGARKGKRVKQGQIIGYIGKSGLATGPHLHYEFRVNGVHRNPLRVKFPGVAPIAKEHREDFENRSQSLLAQLDVLDRTWLALNEQPD